MAWVGSSLETARPGPAPCNHHPKFSRSALLSHPPGLARSTERTDLPFLVGEESQAMFGGVCKCTDTTS